MPSFGGWGNESHSFLGFTVPDGPNSRGPVCINSKNHEFIVCLG